MSEYPEHDKLIKVRQEAQAQGEFLDWVCEKEGIQLETSIRELLAEYYGVDLAEFEAEKRAMLAKMRSLQGE